MRTPGFTAESSIHGALSPSGGVALEPAGLEAASSALARRRFGYTCVGRYCDCDGTSDCVDMINGKCGPWTRCVVINGTLRCLCEPRI